MRCWPRQHQGRLAARPCPEPGPVCHIPTRCYQLSWIFSIRKRLDFMSDGEGHADPGDVARAGLVLASCTPTSVGPGDRAAAPRKTARSFVAGSRLLKTEKAMPGRYIVVLDEQPWAKEVQDKARVGLLADQLSALHVPPSSASTLRVLMGFARDDDGGAAMKLSRPARAHTSRRRRHVSPLADTSTNVPWARPHRSAGSGDLEGRTPTTSAQWGARYRHRPSAIRLTLRTFGGRATRHAFSPSKRMARAPATAWPRLRTWLAKRLAAPPWSALQVTCTLVRVRDGSPPGS
jgi:hypothetical protein